MLLNASISSYNQVLLDMRSQPGMKSPKSQQSVSTLVVHLPMSVDSQALTKPFTRQPQRVCQFNHLNWISTLSLYVLLAFEITL